MCLVRNWRVTGCVYFLTAGSCKCSTLSWFFSSLPEPGKPPSSGPQFLLLIVTSHFLPFFFHNSKYLLIRKISVPGTGMEWGKSRNLNTEKNILHTLLMKLSLGSKTGLLTLQLDRLDFFFCFTFLRWDLAPQLRLSLNLQSLSLPEPSQCWYFRHTPPQLVPGGISFNSSLEVIHRLHNSYIKLYSCTWGIFLLLKFWGHGCNNFATSTNPVSKPVALIKFAVSKAFHSSQL